MLSTCTAELHSGDPDSRRRAGELLPLTQPAVVFRNRILIARRYGRRRGSADLARRHSARVATQLQLKFVYVIQHTCVQFLYHRGVPRKARWIEFLHLARKIVDLLLRCGVPFGELAKLTQFAHTLRDEALRVGGIYTGLRRPRAAGGAIALPPRVDVIVCDVTPTPAAQFAVCILPTLLPPDLGVACSAASSAVRLPRLTAPPRLLPGALLSGPAGLLALTSLAIRLALSLLLA